MIQCLLDRMLKRHTRVKPRALFAAVLFFFSGALIRGQVTLVRDGATVRIEPYAANIVRLTLSLDRDQAMAPPGLGFVAKPSSAEWTSDREGTSGAVLRSPQLIVSVPTPRPGPEPLPTETDIAKFFTGSAPGVGIEFKTPDGKTLLHFLGWGMSVPNYKDGNAGVAHDRRNTDLPFFRVAAIFASPADEHYYGLGQNQEGYLDRRGHKVDCWNDYDAAAGPSSCMPFVVTNYGYGLVWDNPSKTSIEFGFNERTKWTSEVGNRVSFFVIAGKSPDEIYAGYRQLTGVTHLLPKAAYGFIQCKQRYSSQAEVLAVANGYRERNLPLDALVVDWFYYTKMGQMDMDPARWPDPAEMNRQLHQMGIQTMISVWPRFTSGSRYYDYLLQKGWFEKLADGTPTNGLPYDKAGSDLDTTNPEAARWYWDRIRENFVAKGFDSFWADETEPDLPPNGSYFHIGPGTRFFNPYPLLHTAAFYDGFRRDLKTRAFILSRDFYLGAQRNGTIFWSSDIHPTWDTLKRQIPTGLNVTASGIAYWGNDIGGWQYLAAEHHPARTPLIDPTDARDNVGGYDDYPELYVRWFEYGAFQPNFRTHGSRRYNEVWSYGKQAEPILEKYLRLRYQLLPYIYSLGYRTYASGAPYMRALWMDFPSDPNVTDIGDEYMFGPAFLVAPVTEQGAVTRRVYLPAGTDWYNYWTNEQVHGGQTVDVQAPIDTLPLFVRAGSIVPTGEQISSTAQTQSIASVRVYPGADGTFTLYSDDGRTYEYEAGQSSITTLRWDDKTRKLSHEGTAAWTKPDTEVVKIISQDRAPSR